MANLLGVSKETLKKWEYGKRLPIPTARILMIIMYRDPGVIEIMEEATGTDLTPVKRGRPVKG